MKGRVIACLNFQKLQARSLLGLMAMSTVVCQCVPLLSPSPTRGGEILFSWAGRLHGGILLALIVKIEV